MRVGATHPQSWLLVHISSSQAALPPTWILQEGTKYTCTLAHGDISHSNLHMGITWQTEKQRKGRTKPNCQPHSSTESSLLSTRSLNDSRAQGNLGAGEVDGSSWLDVVVNQLSWWSICHRTHVEGEGQNQLHKTILWPMHRCAMHMTYLITHMTTIHIKKERKETWPPPAKHRVNKVLAVESKKAWVHIPRTCVKRPA